MRAGESLYGRSYLILFNAEKHCVGVGKALTNKVAGEGYWSLCEVCCSPFGKLAISPLCTELCV